MQSECIFLAKASVIETLYTRSVFELNGSQKPLQSPSGFSVNVSYFSFLFYVFILFLVRNDVIPTSVRRHFDVICPLEK